VRQTPKDYVKFAERQLGHLGRERRLRQKIPLVIFAKQKYATTFSAMPRIALVIFDL
jgi:hypothetical protein